MVGPEPKRYGVVRTQRARGRQPDGRRRRLERQLRRSAVAVGRIGVRIALSALSRDRSGRRPVLQGGEPLFILIADAYGMGGTIRTAFNTAEWLARRHPVEIVSATRARDATFFPVPSGVRIRPLDDRRAGHGPRGVHGWLRRRLTAVPSPFADGTGDTYPAWNVWTDLMVVLWMRSLRGGVLITTRPRFNVLAGRLTRRSVFLIGQEHLNAAAYRADVQEIVKEEYGHLDVLAVLTDADKADYEAMLSGRRVRIVRIPNAARQSQRNPAIEERRSTIVAAGRLRRVKGFDLLIDAWSRIEQAWPEWTVDVYGRGPDLAALQADIDRRHMSSRMRLVGPAPDLQQRFEAAGIFVLSSRLEGFPLVLVEAMAAGCPVVSFDCPRGPAEIIRDHVNGTLVRAEDVAALAAAIEELLRSPTLRSAYSRAAAETARSYSLDSIGARWDAVLGPPGSQPPAVAAGAQR
jgi:glycosyltransferase involved in cell wall biosynthesis